MWPIKCLQFLDVAFGKNPYPGAAERGQLVIECNRLLGKLSNPRKFHNMKLLS